MIPETIKLLRCPICSCALEPKGEHEIKCINPKCQNVYAYKNGIFSFLKHSGEKNLELSIQKWEEFYAERAKSTNPEEQLTNYCTNDFPHVYKQISDVRKLNKEDIFLELGCGPMLLATKLAEECSLVVGIDFSLEALVQARALLESKGITNYLLIHGDIKHMPLADNSVTVVYGGGVIEHFEDTQQAVNEFYRVLKQGGFAFNTVPYLNIGSLTYRQVWGNIPNVLGLKQLAEFIHIKVLKSKHMRFGYELSFLGTHIKYIHKRAGFSKVIVDKFDTHLEFEFIKNPDLRKAAIWLAENVRLFWPMIKVIGVK